MANLNEQTVAVPSLITSPYKTTCETCLETLILDVDLVTVLQARFHLQALAATLMMTVSTIIPSSDFVTHQRRLVEILTVENLITKNVKAIIQNIKGLLFLSDILVEHLRESTQLTHHVHNISCKRLVE